jgi:hypothetical protein
MEPFSGLGTPNLGGSPKFGMTCSHSVYEAPNLGAAGTFGVSRTLPELQTTAVQTPPPRFANRTPPRQPSPTRPP